MAGPLRAVLDWWLSELASLLPAALRAAPAPAAELWVEAEGPRLVNLRGRSAEPTRPTDAADAARALGRRGALAVVRLRRGAALRPVVDLPAAAASNLAEALAFEMDRHTPFPAGAVRFDARIAGRDEQAGRISVEMEVARISDVDAALAEARRLRLTPVQVTGAEGASPFNLLAAAERPRPSRLAPRLIGALAVIAALTGAAAGAAWYDRTTSRLAAVEARLEAARRDAGAASRAEADLAELWARAARIHELKRAATPIVAILDEVTRKVGDAHWAETLRIEGGELRLDGLSAAPADLLAALETAEGLSGARFDAAVLRDQASGLDRVAIAADVDGGGP